MALPPKGGLNLFRVTLPICAVVATVGIVRPDVLNTAAEFATGTTFRALDWFYLVATTSLLLVAFWLAFSRYGAVRLGRPGEEPEFSTASWLAMLFAAGMGTGILFWGVAEPMTHFTSAPGAEPGTAAAARRALAITGFHWGLHAWAIYCIAALVLAYFGFRRRTPYLPGAPIRAAFSGRWVGPLAALADTIAVLAVTFGVAASVPMGIFQFQEGLGVVTGVDPESMTVSFVILAVLVACYMTSAATSLDKGIKWLSNINMSLAIVLVLFIIVAGPTDFIFRSMITSVGDYVSGVFSLALSLYPYENPREWLEGWTLTWLIWWIAWAPFVGVFIARISRGRTIREFVLGVILAPTGFSLVWFGVFGGTSFYEELYAGGGISALVREDVTYAIFALFERLPGTEILSLAAISLVFIFLVTSVDSATFVLGMLTSRGSMDPPRSRKLAWGVSLGLVSAALMLSRSIEAIRAVAVLGAIPFTFLMLVQLAALLRSIRGSEEVARKDAGAEGEEAPR